MPKPPLTPLSMKNNLSSGKPSQEKIFAELKEEIGQVDALFKQLSKTEISRLEVRALQKKYDALKEEIKKIEDALLPDIIA